MILWHYEVIVCFIVNFKFYNSQMMFYKIIKNRIKVSNFRNFENDFVSYKFFPKWWHAFYLFYFFNGNLFWYLQEITFLALSFHETQQNMTNLKQSSFYYWYFQWKCNFHSFNKYKFLIHHWWNCAEKIPETLHPKTSIFNSIFFNRKK